MKFRHIARRKQQAARFFFRRVTMDSTAHGSASAVMATAPTTRPPRIATTTSSPTLPTTVLVHGLESSKETWRGVSPSCSLALHPPLQQSYARCMNISVKASSWICGRWTDFTLQLPRPTNAHESNLMLLLTCPLQVLQHCQAHALPAVALDLRGHGESELGMPRL